MTTQPDKQQRDLQHDRRSATNRAWGESHDSGDQSFGFEGQGGYGDFRTQAPQAGDTRARDAGDASRDGASGNARRPDDQLRAVIADALATHDRLDAKQVLVAAEDGVVTLTGEVREPWMKDCAEEVATGFKGVREVRNLVQFDDGSASFGPPGRAVRSGFDQAGSAFSSSAKVDDALRGSEADWPNDQALPAAQRGERDPR